MKVEFRDALFVLQDIGPMSDDEVESLYYAVPEYQQSECQQVEEPFAVQWDKLEEIWSRWNKDEFSVEPGETAAHTVEFVIPMDAASVLITTYVYNSKTMGKINDELDSPVNAQKQKRGLLRWREVEGPRGWTRVTAYDIIFEIGVQEDE